MTFLYRRDRSKSEAWGIYAKFKDGSTAQLALRGQTAWPLRKAKAIQRDIALYILHDPSCPLRYTAILKEDQND